MKIVLINKHMERNASERNLILSNRDGSLSEREYVLLGSNLHDLDTMINEWLKWLFFICFLY